MQMNGRGYVCNPVIQEHFFGKAAQPTSERSSLSETSNSRIRGTVMDQYSAVDITCKRIAKELLDTEVKYCHDLKLCKQVFGQGLRNVISTEVINQLFLNCDQLISLSTSIANSLTQGAPGDVFVEKISQLRVYVEFCSKQQFALERLNELEHNNAAFRQIYRSCCMKANGLNLSYFLLLPMNRITRYPLIFDKLVKYTQPKDPKRENLERAYVLLKSLCTEINNVISAMDNSNMLIWAQQHIHCEAIQPPIVFPSSTRNVGPRCLLHSGVLQKQRSGKILITLLFNDFLMFTTPVEPMEQLEEFKISKSTEVQLNLYKMPMLLENVKVIQNKEMDDCSFEVRNGDLSVILRAPSRNSRVLWVTQIDKALSEYHDRCMAAKKMPLKAGITEKGRLFVELICVRNMDNALRLFGSQSVSCKFQLGESSAYVDVDLSRKEHLCTTQLPIFENASDEYFKVAIFMNRIFSPDLCAGTSQIAMADLLSAATTHRGPMSKQFNCESADISNLRPVLILKFVIQLFY